MKILLNREGFVDLINERKYEIIAEVGVFCGEYTEALLKTNAKTVYAVDTWANGDGTFNEQCFQAFLRRTVLNKDKLSIIKEDSVTASKGFKDGSLDFVYIDADHSYECVKADLECWWPKIKQGGALSGDDFAHGCLARCPQLTKDTGISGVDTAVREFAEKYGLTLNLTKQGNINWWFDKH